MKQREERLRVSMSKFRPVSVHVPARVFRADMLNRVVLRTRVHGREVGNKEARGN